MVRRFLSRSKRVMRSLLMPKAESLIEQLAAEQALNRQLRQQLEECNATQAKLSTVSKQLHQAQQQLARLSKSGALNYVKQMGINPKTVIDVGAAVGTFELNQAFPEAKHVLIEPIQENEPYLSDLCRQIKDAEYLIAAAGRESKTVQLQVYSDLTFSCIYSGPEARSSSLNLREVQSITLDDLCAERNLEGPYLIKLDVDGAEVDVVAGATQTLKATDYLVTEAIFFNDRIYDLIEVLKHHGFVLYDIIDFLYRPLDQALWQVDLAFVPESSPLRKSKEFYPPDRSSEAGGNTKTWRDQMIDQLNH